MQRNVRQRTLAGTEAAPSPFVTAEKDAQRAARASDWADPRALQSGLEPGPQGSAVGLSDSRRYADLFWDEV